MDCSNGLTNNVSWMLFKSHFTVNTVSKGDLMVILPILMQSVVIIQQVVLINKTTAALWPNCQSCSQKRL